MELIYLSEEQMLEAGVKDMKRCNEVMEKMFALLKRGDYRMPGEDNSDHGARVRFPSFSEIQDMPLDAPGRWFTAMPAYLGGDFHIFGIKTYGANQNNTKKGLPRSILMMQLLDVETGAPIAYMSANIMSAMRTGAVSGIGAKYLAPEKPRKLAVIGPGIMSRYSLDSIVLECPTIKEVAILGRGEKNIKTFKTYCEEKYSFKDVTVAVNVEEVCNNADIILAVPSRGNEYKDYPLIKKAYIKKGALVIFANAMRVEQDIVQNENEFKFVADNPAIFLHEIAIDAKANDDGTILFYDALYQRLRANKEVMGIADIIENSEFKREQDKIYFYQSFGMAIEDVAWGYECYKEAIKKNIGTTLLVWKESML